MPLSNRQFKDAIYRQLTRIGKSVACPTRLELLDLLCQGPRTVESLAQQAGQSVANTSKHLRSLYEATHVPRAISAPVAELDDLLAQLPNDKQIVVYSRGPYCVMSIDAVRILRERDFDAARLEDGVSDWRAKGLTLDTTSH